MLTRYSLLLCITLSSLLACNTARNTPDASNTELPTVNPTAATTEECQRRAAAMVQMERDMRSSPQEIVDTAQPPPKAANWDNTNNPCPETVAQVDPAEDRLITRTQIETAMQEQNYERARQLLPKLYISPMPLDTSLQALTHDIAKAWAPTWIAEHQSADSIIMRQGKPVCVATREAHAVHDDYDTLSEIVGGPQIHLYCGVPDSQADMGTQIRVRYRLGTGRYEELLRQDLGALPDLTVDEGIHITMDLPERFLEENAQAYFEVSLMGLTPGQVPTPLSRGAFFWAR